MKSPFLMATEMPPLVGSQEMRRLDYWAMREFQLPLLLMTENAGRSLAEFVLRRFAPARDETVLVLAGKGGNGAGVLAAARHLRHRGYAVSALLTEPATKLRDEAQKHLGMFRKEGGSAVPFRLGEPLPDATVVLDGVLGYGLTDSPKGPALRLIQAANESGKPVVALDLPSGLDPDTGEPSKDTIRATATVTLALPKTGLVQDAAAPYVGELYMADIAFPRVLYEEFGTTPEKIFQDDVIVRLPVPTPSAAGRKKKAEAA